MLRKEYHSEVVIEIRPKTSGRADLSEIDIDNKKLDKYSELR